MSELLTFASELLTMSGVLTQTSGLPTVTDRIEFSICSKFLDTPIHPPLGIVRSFHLAPAGAVVGGGARTNRNGGGRLEEKE